MDFKAIDIRRFLIDSIPSRFSHLSPSDFIAFVAHVFEVDGYKVDQINRKGDLAPVILATKDLNTLVIKALRYPQEHLVKNHEIQQVAGSRDYYEANQAWIITTSSFDNAAKKTAEELDVELWDWDAFYQALTQLFFDGKSHYEFLNTVPVQSEDVTGDIQFKLKVKWKAEEGVSSEWYNLELAVTNATEQNLYVHFDLPALIDPNKTQFMAEQWSENEFISGMIYSGASVKTNALFKASRLGERPPGGKVMLTCHVRTEPPVTTHLSARLKGSACYVVTYCYSSHSEEFRLMTMYRDNVMARYLPGRIFIDAYYWMSPFLVRLAARYGFINNTLKFVVDKIIKIIKKKYS